MKCNNIPVEDLWNKISSLTKREKSLIIKFPRIFPVRERQRGSPLLAALGYFHDEKMLWQPFFNHETNTKRIGEKSLCCLIAQLWNSTLRLLYSMR